MKKISRLAFVFASIFCLIPGIASACSVCFGAPADHPMTESLNLAIIALIGVTGTVLGGISTFFIFLARRGKKFSEIMEIYDSHNGNGRAH